MKRSWWPSGAILVWLTLVFYGASAGVAWAGPLVLTEKDSGRTVNVTVGQSLVVDLRLGAGQHVIAPEFNHEVLTLVGQSLQSTTGPQGAFSRIIYQFIVRQGGQTELVVDVIGSGKKEDKTKPLLKIKIMASGGGANHLIPFWNETFVGADPCVGPNYRADTRVCPYWWYNETDIALAVRLPVQLSARFFIE